MDEDVGEVELSADIYRSYVDSAKPFLGDEPIEPPAGTGTALIRRA